MLIQGLENLFGKFLLSLDRETPLNDGASITNIFLKEIKEWFCLLKKTNDITFGKSVMVTLFGIYLFRESFLIYYLHYLWNLMKEDLFLKYCQHYYFISTMIIIFLSNKIFYFIFVMKISKLSSQIHFHVICYSFF